MYIQPTTKKVIGIGLALAAVIYFFDFRDVPIVGALDVYHRGAGETSDIL